MKRIFAMVIASMVMCSCGDLVRLKQMIDGDKDEQLESLNKKVAELEEELEEEKAARQEMSEQKSENVQREYSDDLSGGYQGENPYEWLSQRKYTQDELWSRARSAHEVRVWRNAMFARHGYIFKSEDLMGHFKQFSWYEPRYTSVTLTPIEEHNVNVLKGIEDRLNR